MDAEVWRGLGHSETRRPPWTSAYAFISALNENTFFVRTRINGAAWFKIWKKKKKGGWGEANTVSLSGQAGKIEKEVTSILKTSFWFELWTSANFTPWSHTVMLLFKAKFMANLVVPKPIYRTSSMSI